MMNNIKHVFFDLDNTLWDYRANSIYTLEGMFERCQIKEKYDVDFTVWHEVFCEIHEQLWVDYREGRIKQAELRARRFSESFDSVAVKDKEIHNYFEKTYVEYVSLQTRLCPHSEEILEYLQQKGYMLHVVSNGFIDATQAKINNSSLKKYINTITSSEKVGYQKPHPSVFAYALNQAGAKVEESIFVGDDYIADIQGAENFGMRTIFYNQGEEKNEVGEITIRSLDEIKKYII